ncbi:hypothetical protein Aph01nite_34680 [Acrocarpospora phusangensis]|uniref:Secreted protein n=1 Tax=Acrocarpospora phusangensis TaxID=1070424 RepID=A0A919UPA2_9ACTN|nr:hypothetical protein [Acrocarpospora phusangensis]GIH25158.1 hypothetical protein Aph01nite_34680 [Acrocarpospora phusangensis]
MAVVVPATGPAPAPSPPRAPRLRTVPGRIRAGAGAAVLAVGLLSALMGVALGHAGDGLRAIGHTAGPQVVATADLYFALSDMDAQVATVLLSGAEGGPGRQAALDRYDQRRAQADSAVLQAADLARGDPTGQLTVRAVLDGLGRYERLAARALLLDEQSPHAAGPPSQQALDVYRQATDLMRLDLLPKAYNLTLDSGTVVRHAYAAESSAVLAGRFWVMLGGAVALAVLVALQVFLVRRFRRATNPALLAATVVVGVLTVAGVLVLQRASDEMRTAKEDGFDSVLVLSRARAIGNSLHGDESRYLLDPQRADTYEQVYLDKSQSLLYVPGGNLDKYYAAVDETVPAFPGKSDFLGFYGSEADRVTLPGQREALAEVLKHYQQFQRDDRKMRQFATAGKNSDAVRQAMGTSFGVYDDALVELTELRRQAFGDAVAAGDRAIDGWNLLVPGAALAAALLILVGVRPRLAEYR